MITFIGNLKFSCQPESPLTASQGDAWGNSGVWLRSSWVWSVQSQCPGSEGTPSPARPCPAPRGSPPTTQDPLSAPRGCPHPARGPRPHVSLPGCQPLPQRGRSTAGLQLPTALPGHGPCRAGPTHGPTSRPGLDLSPSPGGAQGWGCLWLPGSGGVSVLALVSPSIMFRRTDLALLKFGVGFTGPRKRRRQYAGSCCKSRGSGFFFSPPFPNC